MSPQINFFWRSSSVGQFLSLPPSAPSPRFEKEIRPIFLYTFFKFLLATIHTRKDMQRLLYAGFFHGFPYSSCNDYYRYWTYYVLMKRESKGWEPTFWAFGLSKELCTRVCFAFSNNGLKSQNLQFGMKKSYRIFLIIIHDLKFGLGKVTTHLIYHCFKCLFQTKKLPYWVSIIQCYLSF